jgi:hypothetical protein
MTSPLDNLVRIGRRNLAEYEGELEIDEAILAALLRIVRIVAERVSAYGPVDDT